MSIKILSINTDAQQNYERLSKLHSQMGVDIADAETKLVTMKMQERELAAEASKHAITIMKTLLHYLDEPAYLYDENTKETLYVRKDIHDQLIETAIAASSSQPNYTNAYNTAAYHTAINNPYNAAVVSEHAGASHSPYAYSTAGAAIGIAQDAVCGYSSAGAAIGIAQDAVCGSFSQGINDKN